jgi:hypothetical protein
LESDAPATQISVVRTTRNPPKGTPLDGRDKNLEYLKMKKIALTAATLLALSGVALAEDQNGGGPDINAIAAQQRIDTVQTSSVSQSPVAYELRNSNGTIAEKNSQSALEGVRTFGNN